VPLIQLWEKTPDIVLQYNCKQIVSAAGDGILSDKSECSRELRHYLRNIPVEKLFDHVEYCLTNPFDRSGYALQDIINELGRRLDYEVSDGLYQGRINGVGYDGIWTTPDGHSIVVEVKTSDAYRINLDKGAAGYRARLIDNGQITKKSSILIVVGRADTGDLEAQIRGSRHAWDARIISTDALVKLVELKVKSDEDETTEKIRSLLVPFEYTRLDNIIEVMFAAAKDVETAANEEELTPTIGMAEDSRAGHKQDHTPKSDLDGIRDLSLAALGRRERIAFIAHKRAQYWDSEKKIRAVCPVSKLYPRGYYWYGFHPHQQKFLSEAERGFLLLGCMDSEFTYALPFQIISEALPYLNTTVKSDRMYWHIHLHPSDDGGYQLLIPKKNHKLDLEPYTLSLSDTREG
jgi:hypothetical protein